MARNCFQYFGFKSLEEVDDMLIPEYSLLMESHALRRLEEERDMHWQAYLYMAVQETEERGKKSYKKYPKFEKFFDYEKLKKEMFGEKKMSKKEDRHKEIKDLILIANRKGG